MDLKIHRFHSTRDWSIIASSPFERIRDMTADTAIRDREALVERCIPFLEEVKNTTASAAVERWLNEKYGPESALFQTLARLVKKGVADGWAAHVEIEGPRYRRS